MIFTKFLNPVPDSRKKNSGLAISGPKNISDAHLCIFYIFIISFIVPENFRSPM
jgi:hypothetical protein